jgi:hypothetical protein
LEVIPLYSIIGLRHIEFNSTCPQFPLLPLEIMSAFIGYKYVVRD